MHLYLITFIFMGNIGLQSLVLLMIALFCKAFLLSKEVCLSIFQSTHGPPLANNIMHINNTK